MAHAVILPKLGQTVEEATIVCWHKKEGDKVKKGDIIFEIETDKTVLEAESFHEGTLLKILIKEGETAPVLSIVAYIGKMGEDITDNISTKKLKSPQPSKPSPLPPSPSKLDDPVDSVITKNTHQQLSPPPHEQKTHKTSNKEEHNRIFISPRAKALAKSAVINPCNITGTGHGGRIIEKDVSSYLIDNNYNKIKITPSAKNLAAKENIDILKIGGTGTSGRITISDIERTIAEKPKLMGKRRQVIAKRLTDSFTTTPHFYVTVSVDMSDLLILRKELKEHDNIYTVTDFILEAVILSLLEFPALNSSTDGKTVKWNGRVDLGMAVGLKDGLVVPVLKNSNDLSMKELHNLAAKLKVKAYNGTLTPDEMTGSTFTLSNMGMMDIENFSAIINPGESAILAVSSTMEKVIVINGQMQIRSIMKITLSSDHRIVDGGMAASFINAIKNKLQDIELWKNLT